MYGLLLNNIYIRYLYTLDIFLHCELHYIYVYNTTIYVLYTSIYILVYSTYMHIYMVAIDMCGKSPITGE